MQLPIRNVTEKDLDEVLSINESVVPAVNSLSKEEMSWFMHNAHYFKVIDFDGKVAAFLIGLRPGLNYRSLNYRYFCEHYDDFGYVDRVAVSDHARRMGLASSLYVDFADFLKGEVVSMTCEVNIRPPNQSSMEFHERFGFEKVASQETEGGKKEVALLEKRLD